MMRQFPLPQRETATNTSYISRPIEYYTQDSLNFNTEKKQLYGEIHSKSSPELPPRPELRPSPRRWLLAFAAITVLSLTSLTLYATVIPIWERNFEHTKFPIRGDWTDGFIIFPLAISVISGVSVVLSILRRRRQYSRTQYLDFPGKSRASAHSSGPDAFYMIILSTTILLILVPLLVLASTNSLARAFRDGPPPIETASGLTVCTVGNMLTRPCLPILYRIGGLQVAGAVTAGLTCSMWIVVLFLSARSYCRLKKEARLRKEARRRRREARRKARNNLPRGGPTTSRNPPSHNTQQGDLTSHDLPSQQQQRRNDINVHTITNPDTTHPTNTNSLLVPPLRIPKRVHQHSHSHPLPHQHSGPTNASQHSQSLTSPSTPPSNRNDLNMPTTAQQIPDQHPQRYYHHQLHRVQQVPPTHGYRTSEQIIGLPGPTFQPGATFGAGPPSMTMSQIHTNPPPRTQAYPQPSSHNPFTVEDIGTLRNSNAGARSDRNIQAWLATR